MSVVLPWSFKKWQLTKSPSQVHAITLNPNLSSLSTASQNMWYKWCPLYNPLTISPNIDFARGFFLSSSVIDCSNSSRWLLISPRLMYPIISPNFCKRLLCILYTCIYLAYQCACCIQGFSNFHFIHYNSDISLSFRTFWYFSWIRYLFVNTAQIPIQVLA